MAILSGRSELATTPADGDLIHVVDISDTTDNAAGTSKKITAANLLSGVATELSDLSDVNTSTVTNRNALMADGVDWESRALVEADISDLGSYLEVVTSGEAVNDVLVHNGTSWVNDGGHLSDFFNGTFAEKFNALVTSDGATVTMSIEQQGGGDLTKRFSTGKSTLDCTPAATIALSAGTDASPTDNYVYVLRSTGALTTSTSGWPATEHIKIGYFFVPSATFVQANGVYINQNWNDEVSDSTGQGHLTHIAERIRADGCYYKSGVDGNGTDGYLTPTASNVEFKSTAGVAMQMHTHTIPAHDTSASGVVLVTNWNGDAYHDITNLFDITADSTGSTISNNKYFNIFFWGVANKGGTFTPVMANLPSGFYNSQTDAEGDVSGYNDDSIASEFTTDSSTGFPICRVTIKMGTTWTVMQTVDLRTSGSLGGGVTGSVQTEFSDSSFRVNDNTDPTKQIALEASGITTGTTRTITMPDSNVDLGNVGKVDFIIALSDETTALTTGVAKTTFRMPYAMTLTEVRASVTTAPTGSVLTVDINETATTILSTKLTIDATEKTSTTAATAAVISDSALADDAEITIDIDGVGSTVAGAGLKVTFIGTRA